MTNLAATPPNVTLRGVTHRNDLRLRLLWLGDYAPALGPHLYVPPPPRGLSPEYDQANGVLMRIRMALPPPDSQSDLQRAIRQWLRAVDHCGGMHGLRPAAMSMLQRETGLPSATALCEPYLRAGVDDALVRLEGRDYTDCVRHVASEITGLCAPNVLADLRAHLASILAG